MRAALVLATVLAIGGCAVRPCHSQTVQSAQQWAGGDFSQYHGRAQVVLSCGIGDYDISLKVNKISPR